MAGLLTSADVSPAPKSAGLLSASDLAAPSDSGQPANASEEAAFQESGIAPQDTETSKAVLRGAAHGALGLPELAANIGGGLVNKTLNRGDEQAVQDVGTSAVDKLLSAIGLNKPQDDGRKAVEMASMLAFGAMTPYGSRAATARAARAGDPAAGTVGLEGWSVAAGSKTAYNQATQNNLWAQAIGEPGVTKFTRDEANAAETRLGNVFDIARNSRDSFYIGFSPKEVADRFSRMLQPIAGEDALASPTVKRIIDYFNKTQSPWATGEKLGQWSTVLRQEMSQAYQDSNYLKGNGLKLVREYLEDQLQAGLSKPMQAIYQQAKGQYRTLMQVTESPTGVWNPSTGNIDGPAMARFLQRTTTGAFARTPFAQLPNQYKAAALAAHDFDAQSLISTVKETASNGVLPASVKNMLRVFPLAKQALMQKGPGAMMDVLRQMHDAAAPIAPAANIAAGAGQEPEESPQ